MILLLFICFLIPIDCISPNLLYFKSYLVLFFVLVMNDSTRTEVSIDKSEVDKLVDRIDFGELCNDFECTSSPQVESTARQLVRDILEIREGNRAFACYAVSVKYKVHFSVTL